MTRETKLTTPATPAALRPPQGADESFVDEPAGLMPARPVSRPGAPRVQASPRSLGERLDRERRAMRAKVLDLKAQLAAARAELDELHQDGWADVRRALLRESSALGIDLRRASRDLLGHVLADRNARSAQAAATRALVDQLRNTLARVDAGEIGLDEAHRTLAGVLSWRDAEVGRLEAGRVALHPGPAANPCPECGRERGAWDDCSACMAYNPDAGLEAAPCSP